MGRIQRRKGRESEGGEESEGVREKERERFMSDMVIFISPGKKVGFHAVGAFILVSNDKGSRATETR